MPLKIFVHFMVTGYFKYVYNTYALPKEKSSLTLSVLFIIYYLSRALLYMYLKCKHIKTSIKLEFELQYLKVEANHLYFLSFRFTKISLLLSL